MLLEYYQSSLWKYLLISKNIKELNTTVSSVLNVDYIMYHNIIEV